MIMNINFYFFVISVVHFLDFTLNSKFFFSFTRTHLAGEKTEKRKENDNMFSATYKSIPHRNYLKINLEFGCCSFFLSTEMEMGRPKRIRLPQRMNTFIAQIGTTNGNHRMRNERKRDMFNSTPACQTEAKR